MPLDIVMQDRSDKKNSEEVCLFIVNLFDDRKKFGKEYCNPKNAGKAGLVSSAIICNFRLFPLGLPFTNLPDKMKYLLNVFEVVCVSLKYGEVKEVNIWQELNCGQVSWSSFCPQKL